jgi:hypothetical protein
MYICIEIKKQLIIVELFQIHNSELRARVDSKIIICFR